MTDRTFKVDHRALARVSASSVLALLPTTWGSTMTLVESAPTVAVVSARTLARTYEPDDETDDSSTDDYDDDDQATGSVAILSITGGLAQRADYLCGYVDGYDAIAERVLEATADGNVGALLLTFDSPGGDLAGLEQCVERCRDAIARSGKPVIGYIDELAASAAYWLAAGLCDSIILPEAGRVGSIGVFCAHVDESGALEQDGVKITLIQEPPGKTAGHWAEPLDKEGRSRFQEMVTASADRFFAAVGDYRGIGAKAARALDGRVLHGADAVRAGLADKVGSLEDAAKAAVGAMTGEQEMPNVKKTLAMLVKAPDDASDEQLERGAAAARPLLDLGRAALALTGESDPTKAAAKLSAFSSLDTRLAELERSNAEAAKGVRIAAVQSLVTSRKFEAADVWKDPTKGATTENIAEPWASMDPSMISALGAKAKSSSLAAGATAPTGGAIELGSAPAPIAAATLNRLELKLGARLGVKVEDMAKYKAARVQRERDLENAIGGGE